MWLFFCCLSFLESVVCFWQDPCLYSKLYYNTVWCCTDVGEAEICVPSHSTPYRGTPCPYSSPETIVDWEFIWWISLKETHVCSNDLTVYFFYLSWLGQSNGVLELEVLLLGWQTEWWSKNKQNIVICVHTSSLIPAEHKSKIYIRGFTVQIMDSWLFRVHLTSQSAGHQRSGWRQNHSFLPFPHTWVITMVSLGNTQVGGWEEYLRSSFLSWF